MLFKEPPRFGVAGFKYVVFPFYSTYLLCNIGVSNYDIPEDRSTDFLEILFFTVGWKEKYFPSFAEMSNSDLFIIFYILFAKWWLENKKHNVYLDTNNNNNFKNRNYDLIYFDFLPDFEKKIDFLFPKEDKNIFLRRISDDWFLICLQESRYLSSNLEDKYFSFDFDN